MPRGFFEFKAVTGCMVLVCEQVAVAGVVVSGGPPTPVAAEVVAEGIVRAIEKAETLAGVSAAKDAGKC